jgi:hypothetical protein
VKRRKELCFHEAECCTVILGIRRRVS